MLPVLVFALLLSLLGADDPYDVASAAPPSTSLGGRVVEGQRHELEPMFVHHAAPADFETDDLTALRLEQKLTTDPALAPHVDTVTVDVVDGRVTLRGMIDARWRSSVIRATAETVGVTSIRDRMRSTDGV